MTVSRRSFLAMAASGLAVPGALASGTEWQGRRFLFVFVRGGWDPTVVFAPMFDSPYVDTDEGSFTSEAGGLPFVDSEERPHVRAFFEQYGSRTCIVNGLEVEAITHAAARRLAFTGSRAPVADDWPAMLAGAADDLPLPGLVISGPSFTRRFTGSVMRIGQNGQLAQLLAGTAFEGSDIEVPTLGDSSDRLVEAWLAGRSGALEAAGRGQRARFGQSYQRALEQEQLIRSLGTEIDFGTGEGTANAYVYAYERLAPAFTCLELGLTRCAVVEHRGYVGLQWDTHSQNRMQTGHYETLFMDLLDILAELDARRGPAGGSLADETTVVVFSEMGRAPQLNSADGKDHWTYTSAMLVGAGVRGGQVLGAFSDGLIGEPVDLATGIPSDTGERMTSSHLGATLLALGGLDPGAFSVGAEPIEAVLA